MRAHVRSRAIHNSIGARPSTNVVYTCTYYTRIHLYMCEVQGARSSLQERVTVDVGYGVE